MHSVETILSSSAGWIRGAKVVLLLSLGLLIPALGLPQQVTGPLVNALLILSVESAGIGAAMTVGMITPLNGLLHGVLPLPLMVMVPFIALGNAVFAGLYGILRQRNYWLAVGAASVAKFALLYASVMLLTVRPLSVVVAGAAQQVALPAALVNMMQWPQLATALSGGVLAFAAIVAYRKRERR